MLLGTVSLWALNFTVSKYILNEGFKPLAYSAVRYACAALVFLAITLLWEGSLRRPRPAAPCGRLHGAPVRKPAQLRLRAEVHDGDQGRAALRDAADLHCDPGPRHGCRAPERALLDGGSALLRRSGAGRDRFGRRSLDGPQGRRARRLRGDHLGGLLGCDHATDAALLAVPPQRRLPRRGDGPARARRVTAARKPELPFRRARLAGLCLRGPRPARDDEPALVHRDRPRRSLAGVLVRQPAAVPGGDHRTAAPLREDHDGAGRRRPRDRRRDRVGFAPWAST